MRRVILGCELPGVSLGLLPPVVFFCLEVGVILIIIDVGDSVLMRCERRSPLKVDSASYIGVTALGLITLVWLGHD